MPYSILDGQSAYLVNAGELNERLHARVEQDRVGPVLRAAIRMAIRGCGGFCGKLLRGHRVLFRAWDAERTQDD